MRWEARAAGRIGMLFALLVIIGKSADALPIYAQKEGRACSYCHVSVSPGTRDALTNKRETTQRNYRGEYYQTHNHSFAGFVEKGSATGKEPSPTFRYVWKEEMTEPVRRVAVGDVTGDGKLRLITLTEKAPAGKMSTLQVKLWDGKAFVTEFTDTVQGAADRLAVARLAGQSKPAVIVTADGLRVWNGKSFDFWPAAESLPILGTVRMADDTERVLLMRPNKSVMAYRVNTASVKRDDWLTDPIPAPQPPASVWGDMHSDADGFPAMGIPDELKVHAVLGIWNVKKFKYTYIYQLKIDRDMDVTADPAHPGKPKITYKDAAYWILIRDLRTGNELWASPRLPSEPYDLAMDDPRNAGKPGFLVLVNGTATGKGRTIAFFAMD